MTKWLTQQEACHRFAAYLHGTVPGYMAELTAVSETKPDDDELEVDVAGQCEILLLSDEPGIVVGPNTLPFLHF